MGLQLSLLYLQYPNTNRDIFICLILSIQSYSLRHQLLGGAGGKEKARLKVIAGAERETGIAQDASQLLE